MLLNREPKSAPWKNPSLKPLLANNCHLKGLPVNWTPTTCLSWRDRNLSSVPLLKALRSLHGPQLRSKTKKLRRLRLMSCWNSPTNLIMKSIWRTSTCDRHSKLLSSVFRPCKFKRHHGKRIWPKNTMRLWKMMTAQQLKPPVVFHTVSWICLLLSTFRNGSVTSFKRLLHSTQRCRQSRGCI